MARADIIVAQPASNNYTGGGTRYHVQIPSGALYCIYIDGVTADPGYRKSTDGGLTWGAFVALASVTATAIAVWYDRWSNISAGLIHVVYSHSDGDDTLYRSINTESNDSLSSQTTVFAGSTTANGGYLSITRARGGNLYVHTVIDAGAEGGFFRSTDTGGTWGSRTVNETIATLDQIILMPGWASDNQDVMAFFWDASADEVSRYLYDDSANTWGETSIATGMVEVATTTSFPHFAAAVDITNSRNLLVAWSAVDLLNADLRCWHVTESAITEVTNVVANSTDDQGFCAIGIDIDTQDWYVFYAGKSDGSETYNTAVKIYYKTSTDDGATWGAETVLTPWDTGQISSIVCTPRFNTKYIVEWFLSNSMLLVNCEVPGRVSPTYQLGI